MRTRFSGRVCLAPFAGAVCALLLGVASSARAQQRITSLSYLGQATFNAQTLNFGGTVVGGLSGLTYDSVTGGYLANSDDRSALNPSRFYALNLDTSGPAFGSGNVSFTGVTTLRDTAGNPFALNATDFESIVLSPDRASVYITSEGDANANQSPSVHQFNRLTGVQTGTFALPSYYGATGPAGTTGIRQNLAFESATIANGTTLVTATENALKQDGPATSPSAGSPSRILAYDLATGQPGAQYAYLTDPNFTGPSSVFSTSGLVDILSLGGNEFVSIERSFSIGSAAGQGTGYGVRLYQFSLDGATNVAGLNALPAGLAGVTPVQKTLLLDLAALNIPLDNIEGMVFGPSTVAGTRDLILVSDDNFSTVNGNGPGTPGQFTQFIAFRATLAAIPEPGTFGLLAFATGGPLLFAARRCRKP